MASPLLMVVADRAISGELQLKMSKTGNPK
jgi:hypothetical protein